MCIEILQEFEQTLFRFQENQTLCGFKHATNGKIFVGKIVAIKSTIVEFSDCTVFDKTSGKYGLIYSDDSKKSFFKLGLKLKASRTPIKVHKRNVRLLSVSELAKWKAENLKHNVIDFSVELPLGVSAKFFEDQIPRIIPEVLSVSCMEKYQKGDGKANFVFRLKIMGDISPQKVRLKVSNLLNSLFVQEVEK